MSDAISSSASLWGTSGSLGVGTASILGGNATNTTPSAATLLSEANASATGPFSAISKADTSSAQNTATTQALGEGKLTTQQHNLIAAIGQTKTNSYSITWNGNGTEPSVVSQVKNYGWIKVIKPTYDATTHSVTSATYQLTPIGKAIYQRTGGANSVAQTVDVTA